MQVQDWRKIGSPPASNVRSFVDEERPIINHRCDAWPFCHSHWRTRCHHTTLLLFKRPKQVLLCIFLRACVIINQRTTNLSVLQRVSYFPLLSILSIILSNKHLLWLTEIPPEHWLPQYSSFWQYPPPMVRFRWFGLHWHGTCRKYLYLPYRQTNDSLTWLTTFCLCILSLSTTDS